MWITNALSGADRRAGEAGSPPGMPGRRRPGRGRRPDRPARNCTGPAKAADRQAARLREDAAPDQARPPTAPEAQIAAAENARAGPQARTRHAEAELQHARADRDQTAGQARLGQPTSLTRSPRSPGNSATSNYQRRTSRSVRARTPTRGSAQLPISATRAAVTGWSTTLCERRDGCAGPAASRASATCACRESIRGCEQRSCASAARL